MYTQTFETEYNDTIIRTIVTEDEKSGFNYNIKIILQGLYEILGEVNIKSSFYINEQTLATFVVDELEKSIL